MTTGRCTSCTEIKEIFADGMCKPCHRKYVRLNHLKGEKSTATPSTAHESATAFNPTIHIEDEDGGVAIYSSDDD